MSINSIKDIVCEKWYHINHSGVDTYFKLNGSLPIEKKGIYFIEEAIVYELSSGTGEERICTRRIDLENWELSNGLVTEVPEKKVVELEELVKNI